MGSLASLIISVPLGGCVSLSAPLTTPGPKETFRILGPDSQVNSREFAGAYHLDGNYIVCFSKRPISMTRYPIFCQDFENLRFGVPQSFGSEFGALNSLDSGATTQIDIP